ncbi:hypothetical protein EC973_007873 [Apophysomyces ossiformis]|uniref:Dilute domain-containing protein n=1 Tax=Apophysomyces ossiformis TaxID=679940 RepID=A0A8H7BTF5_9FUNG|nr:hypothetical protein EC973_007873 [Apophysomyces ossiformis]
MTGTTVLTPPGEPDQILDTSTYCKAKQLTAPSEATGVLTMIREHEEEYEQDSEAVRKQYENMSYDEMSQRMAESYRQLSAMLGNKIDPVPSTSSSDKTDSQDYEPPVDDDLEDENSPQLDGMDETTKKIKLTKIFTRAASSGDVDKVTRLLQDEKLRPYIDINARDDDGTTPLIYAACFGKTDIAQALLAGGAKIDIQDSFGWSALMWATNNNHEGLVKILLEHGASSQTKSAKGRTVFDFVNTDNQKIVDILATNPRDSISSTSSILGRTQGSLSSTSSNAGDNDFYYQSTVEGFDQFMAEEAERRRKLLEAANALADGDDSDEEEEQDVDSEEENDDFEETHEFQWDKCQPDQMFVFGADDLEYILDTVITKLQLPVKSEQEICVPANVVFLSARFAHYFSSVELLHEVLEGALTRMSKVIKANARNIHVLAFWITNFTQLLYYLKKDSCLVIATAEYQLRLSELVSETYTMIIYDTEKRLSKILGPAMVDYEQIPGMEDVNFADDWQRFFRRSSRRSVIVPPDGALAMQMKRHASAPANTENSVSVISPQSITSLLSSTLFVLQSYDVHPTIIIQALAQFIHYISCELFNRILTNKKLLCRSKAMQVRMNLSQIEDWVSQNNLPSSLTSYLDPTTQLLQLLQCLTQLNDLAYFITTVKNFDSLNALQIKRCVMNYRYEVNESRLPEEIEKYAMQTAEDTVRYKQARQSRRSVDVSRKSAPLSRSMSLQRRSSRRDSMSSFVGSLMSSVGIMSSASMPPTVPSTPTTTEAPPFPSPKENSEPFTFPPITHDDEATVQEDENEEDDNDEEDKDIQETKDTKFMLPFSIPSTVHMVSVHGWSPDRSKNENKERQVVPVIPDEWMEKLDKGSCIE